MQNLTGITAASGKAVFSLFAEQQCCETDAKCLRHSALNAQQLAVKNPIGVTAAAGKAVIS